MTKREKVLIAVTVVATGASVCMFAFVSLANFLKTTPYSAPPLVAKIYEDTVEQVATLEPVPVAAVSSEVSPPLQPSSNQASSNGSSMSVSRSNKSDVKVSAQSNNGQLHTTVKLSAPELAELSKILKEAGLDPKDPKLLAELKNLGL